MIVKSKVNNVLDSVEDPRQTLDSSYEKQLELLHNVKRGLTDVVVSKKRLELQANTLQAQVASLEQQAKQALTAGREDLARLALGRKQASTVQLDGLRHHIDDLQKEQDKLTISEQLLTTKVESFRTQKEVIKAQYTAAQATVKIGESVSGLGREMDGVGRAVQRAQDKTESMRARASAIDELVEQGTLPDTLQRDPVAAELNKISAAANVESDFARLKAEVGRP